MTDTDRILRLAAVGSCAIESGPPVTIVPLGSPATIPPDALRAAIDALPAPAPAWKLLPNVWTAQAFFQSCPAMVEYNGFLYTVGLKPGAGPQAHIAKVSMETGDVAVWRAFDNIDGLHRNPSGITALNGKLYVVMGLNAFLVAEVDPDTLEYRDVFSTKRFGNSSRGAITSDGRSLWFAPGGPAARIVKMRDIHTASEFITHANQNCIRFDGRDLFVTCHDPARVYRFSTEEFRIVDHALLTDLNVEYNSIANHFGMAYGGIYTGVDSNSGPLTGTVIASNGNNLVKSTAQGPYVNLPTTGIFEVARGVGGLYQTFSKWPEPARFLTWRDAQPVRYTLGPTQLGSIPAMLFPEGEYFYTLSNNGVVAKHRKGDL